MEKESKIGLFFGTFNPIHMGHMIVANVMLESTDINRVWFVVSPQNPFKKKSNLLHEFERMEMVRAAVYENYRMDVSDIEMKLPKPSYTIDTLIYLSEKFPDKNFVLIIGEDNLHSFHKWKNSDKILENFNLYVYPRPSSLPSAMLENGKVTLIDAPKVDISATFIRNFVKEGKSIQYLVPHPVADMIADKKFYQ